MLIVTNSTELTFLLKVTILSSHCVKEIARELMPCSGTGSKVSLNKQQLVYEYEQNPLILNNAG